MAALPAPMHAPPGGPKPASLGGPGNAALPLGVGSASGGGGDASNANATESHLKIKVKKEDVTDSDTDDSEDEDSKTVPFVKKPKSKAKLTTVGPRYKRDHSKPFNEAAQAEYREALNRAHRRQQIARQGLIVRICGCCAADDGLHNNIMLHNTLPKKNDEAESRNKVTTNEEYGSDDTVRTSNKDGGDD